ncbi:MAG TPA: tetratricopeptide repeat protein, partial [Gemmatimonadales bacterium]|nr:tetratricopeptide repeat protein [Gemmatimonadales bacterium]
MSTIDSSIAMYCNIHVPAAYGLGLAALLNVPTVLQAQGDCPSAAGAVLEAAWREYHHNAMARALEKFEQARRLCPENAEATSGLGFTLLRQGHVAKADSLFRAALRQSPDNSDAWEGRARAAMRLADTASAIEAGRRALTLAPGNSELRNYLDQVAPEWNRTPRIRVRPATLQVVARTRRREFQIRTAAGWRDFYVRGVNLGV